jgi:hypothetical protein
MSRIVGAVAAAGAAVLAIGNVVGRRRSGG